MYHRYMPTANGQYRRQSVPEKPVQRPTPPQAPPSCPPKQETSRPPEREARCEPERACEPKRPPEPQARLPFLEKLLPGVDSGDLLLLLVLLLLVADGSEDAMPMILALAICLLL